MNLCILFAMIDEAQPLIYKLNPSLIIEKPFLVFKKNNIIIAISGIGISNASSCFTYIDGKFNPEIYINAGLAGCISDENNVLDVVLVDKAFYSSANTTGFGYEYGQIPKMPAFYTSDQSLSKKISQIKNFKKLNIATSDIFINNSEAVNTLIKPIKTKIEIVDMECCAFFQSAYLFNKPILAIKIISDVLTKKSNENQFNEILNKASNKISEVIYAFLKSFNVV
ncbi:5'-methylthioadenosine/S-adenosylhomocysteine nucleosidase [Spiroplasma helicoides]|nr:5'-methylthioadenosine/S-adenosylhomocysteine nucleosidase [Spiroplasma helicoides]